MSDYSVDLKKHLNIDATERFCGTAYRLANDWFEHMTPEKPIKYLEIGAFYGANALSVAESYASHKDSEIHCIDPWKDYTDYPEYKEEQKKVYSTFLGNISECCTFA